jgi:hypothetical protein
MIGNQVRWRTYRCRRVCRSCHRPQISRRDRISILSRFSASSSLRESLHGGGECVLDFLGPREVAMDANQTDGAASEVSVDFSRVIIFNFGPQAWGCDSRSCSDSCLGCVVSVSGADLHFFSDSSRSHGHSRKSCPRCSLDVVSQDWWPWGPILPALRWLERACHEP